MADENIPPLQGVEELDPLVLEQIEKARTRALTLYAAVERQLENDDLFNAYCEAGLEYFDRLAENGLEPDDEHADDDWSAVRRIPPQTIVQSIHEQGIER